MKGNIFFTIFLVMSIKVAVFSQTAVSVPNNFIGTWWIDISQEAGVPDGIQTLMSIEIKRDGTWISSVKFIAYNQVGLQSLTEVGSTNGQVMIVESGYVTGATSVEIVLTKLGENRVYYRLMLNGNDLVDEQKRHLTRNEPQVQRQ